MGRRVEQVPSNYVLANFRDVDRPLAPQPRRRPAGPGAAALPADRRLLRRRGLRRPGHPGRRGPDRELRRERRDGAPRRSTAIARPGVATVQIILNAFRLKPLDAGAAGGVGSRRRHPRPGAARVRAAVRPLHPGHRRSPPTTTARTTGTARRSTSARPSPASTSPPASRRRRSSPRCFRRPPAGPRPCAGSIEQPGVTTVIPGARNVEQARANAAAAELPAADAATAGGGRATSTTAGSVPRCTTAGSGHPPRSRLVRAADTPPRRTTTTWTRRCRPGHRELDGSAPDRDGSFGVRDGQGRHERPRVAAAAAPRVPTPRWGANTATR